MGTSRKAGTLLTSPINLWRISNYETLNGEGGRLYAGRWHTAGRPVVYFAESGSGALLETLVHLSLDEEDLPPSYKLLRVPFPRGRRYVELIPSADWRKDVAETQKLGDAWLASKASAFCAVPSALVPRDTNWLLNPEHPDAHSLRIEEVLTAEYDERLLRIRLVAQNDAHPA